MPTITSTTIASGTPISYYIQKSNDAVVTDEQILIDNCDVNKREIKVRWLGGPSSVLTREDKGPLCPRGKQGFDCHGSWNQGGEKNEKWMGGEELGRRERSFSTTCRPHSSGGSVA